jgi:signal transduction histidine kinase
METLPYFRLIVLTVGTLLPFFWMIVILGHRRQRNLERVLFFLCLAITCFCGSSLLALNAQLYYASPPHALLVFAWTFLCLGLWFIPPLVIHLHVEYGSLRELLAGEVAKRVWISVAYVPALLLSPYLLAALRANTPGFQAPSSALGRPFQAWLVAALVIGFYWQRKFQLVSPDDEQKRFHRWLSWDFLLVVANLIFLFTIQRPHGYQLRGSQGLSDLIILLAVVSPLLGFFQGVQNFNFLQIGRQRNLIYAVSGVFLALLYLSFVRRVGEWFEPYLPPAAAAALLLFLPIVFFEPLQRLMRQLLRQTAQAEVDRAQRLMGPINEVARLGDSEKLREFAEKRIGEQLQLAEVKLEMNGASPVSGCEVTAKASSEEVFAIGRAGKYQGRLCVRAHGAMISGETFAGLEFVAEQLPAAFDLCQLIEEKLQLERELAERERMALVGQMAASISHNLKNPLGSIKTILQVQMESAELPASLRGETQMVLDEINRLSGKLNQLLQFSRPGVRPSAKGERCNIAAAARSVAEVLRREAESRGIALEVADRVTACEVACSAESANDILSNVILNAIEAASRGGGVSVGFHCVAQTCIVAVDDDGPGIAADLRERVLEPFFTTKPRGTGLGLAIVARRLEEIGGRLEINSPVRDARGTRFRMEFPLARKEAVK